MKKTVQFNLNPFKFQTCLNHGFPIFFKEHYCFKNLSTNNYHSNSELVAVAESIYAFLRQQKLTNAYFFKHYQFHTYVRII